MVAIVHFQVGIQQVMADSKNTKLAINLLALAVGMLLLAYASVPLYRMFCNFTGYGGTTRQALIAPSKASNRTILVEFNTDIDAKLHWKFYAGERSHQVKVGEQALTYFVAENMDNKPITGRAVYNVIPYKAGAYFNKIQCFCFNEQTLKAGQKVNMPVSFFIDPAMLNDKEMDDGKTITLSYSFFPVK